MTFKSVMLWANQTLEYTGTMVSF